MFTIACTIYLTNTLYISHIYKCIGFWAPTKVKDFFDSRSDELWCEEQPTRLAHRNLTKFIFQSGGILRQPTKFRPRKINLGEQGKTHGVLGEADPANR